MDIFRVSFIGHRVVDEYRQVEEELDEVIELLHRKYGFIDFNVGRNGEFDELATQAVRRFRREWEEWCELTLVEPYPVANLDIIEKSYDSVIIPTDRKCHYKAAIGERNKWLAENCDMMIVYIKRDYGGAYKCYKYAQELGIEHAINENKQISFLYFDYDDKHKKVYRKEGKRYVVSPAYMVWNKDNYYLLCFSNGYADLVTHRLDKMDDVKVDETEREPHPEYEKFNTDEYRKQVFSMFGGELCNVTLLFEPSMLSDMFDRFGDDIRIRKVDENTYSVDVSVQVSKTLFAWIVGTQGKVKISSPRKVLDEFNNFVAKIKEEY